MPSRIKAIVVGLADSDAPDPALAAAVEIARRAGAPLHAVHAFTLPPIFTMMPGLDFVDPRGPQAYAAQLWDEMDAKVRRLHPGADIACHAAPGRPETVLCDVAQDVGAELIVVGATRHARLSQAILGTTAQRVLRASPVPVYVVRGTPRAPRRVLFTTDLSVLSARVHEHGMELLERLFGLRELELRSLLVVFFGILPSPLPQDALDRAARAELGAFLSARLPRGRQVDPAVRYDDPGTAIAAEARDWGAELVVLGTHARATPERIFLGSVAETALRELPCDALVIPPVAPKAAHGDETPAARSATFPPASGPLVPDGLA